LLGAELGTFEVPFDVPDSLYPYAMGAGEDGSLWFARDGYSSDPAMIFHVGCD